MNPKPRLTYSPATPRSPYKRRSPYPSSRGCGDLFRPDGSAGARRHDTIFVFGADNAKMCEPKLGCSSARKPGAAHPVCGSPGRLGLRALFGLRRQRLAIFVSRSGAVVVLPGAHRSVSFYPAYPACMWLHTGLCICVYRSCVGNDSGLVMENHSGAPVFCVDATRPHTNPRASSGVLTVWVLPHGIGT